MTDRVLVFDIPIYRRFALPLSVIMSHKMSTLKDEGIDWHTLDMVAEFSEASLTDWLQTRMGISDVNKYVKEIDRSKDLDVSKLIPLTYQTLADMP